MFGILSIFQVFYVHDFAKISMRKKQQISLIDEKRIFFSNSVIDVVISFEIFHLIATDL